MEKILLKTILDLFFKNKYTRKISNESKLFFFDEKIFFTVI